MTTTRTSLLMRIKDRRHEEAWGEFHELYAPLLHRCARGRGRAREDAVAVAVRLAGTGVTHAVAVTVFLAGVVRGRAIVRMGGRSAVGHACCAVESEHVGRTCRVGGAFRVFFCCLGGPPGREEQRGAA